MSSMTHTALSDCSCPESKACDTKAQIASVFERLKAIIREQYNLRQSLKELFDKEEEDALEELRKAETNLETIREERKIMEREIDVQERIISAPLPYTSSLEIKRVDASDEHKCHEQYDIPGESKTPIKVAYSSISETTRGRSGSRSVAQRSRAGSVARSRSRNPPSSPNLGEKKLPEGTPKSPAKIAAEILESGFQPLRSPARSLFSAPVSIPGSRVGSRMNSPVAANVGLPQSWINPPCQSRLYPSSDLPADQTLRSARKSPIFLTADLPGEPPKSPRKSPVFLAAELPGEPPKSPQRSPARQCAELPKSPARTPRRSPAQLPTDLSPFHPRSGCQSRVPSHSSEATGHSLEAAKQPPLLQQQQKAGGWGGLWGAPVPAPVKAAPPKQESTGWGGWLKKVVAEVNEEAAVGIGRGDPWDRDPFAKRQQQQQKQVQHVQVKQHGQFNDPWNRGQQQPSQHTDPWAKSSQKEDPWSKRNQPQQHIQLVEPVRFPSPAPKVPSRQPSPALKVACRRPSPKTSPKQQVDDWEFEVPPEDNEETKDEVKQEEAKFDDWGFDLPPEEDEAPPAISIKAPATEDKAVANDIAGGDNWGFDVPPEDETPLEAAATHSPAQARQEIMKIINTPKVSVAELLGDSADPQLFHDQVVDQEAAGVGDGIEQEVLKSPLPPKQELAYPEPELRHSKALLSIEETAPVTGKKKKGLKKATMERRRKEAKGRLEELRVKRERLVAERKVEDDQIRLEEEEITREYGTL